MDTQQRARLTCLLDTLQKQLGSLQEECESTKARLESLRAQYSQVVQPPIQKCASKKEAC